MNSPLRVTIVRPKVTGSLATSRALGYLGVLFLNAWILMVILGDITPWHLGYRTTLLGLIAIRSVQNGSNWDIWTQPFDKARDQ